MLPGTPAPAADTTAYNRAMDYFSNHERLWLFGYGSLIYKVDFPFLQRRPAAVHHWQRRFWQGSHDHRGTPDAPGRVATLVETPQAVCRGVALEVTPAVLSHLDQREKNGYLRLVVDVHFADGSSDEALVYIAGPDNPAYLGPATEAVVAAQIRRAAGPSGSNRDYLLQLAEALRTMGVEDAHVFALERALHRAPPGDSLPRRGVPTT